MTCIFNRTLLSSNINIRPTTVVVHNAHMNLFKHEEEGSLGLYRQDSFALEHLPFDI